MSVTLKQETINTALRVGKVTCGYLAARMSEGFYNGDNVNEYFIDLAKMWGYVDALNEVYEVDDVTVFEWQNYLTEAKAKEVIEKVNTIARKRLPALIFNKTMENKPTLI